MTTKEQQQDQTDVKTLVVAGVVLVFMALLPAVIGIAKII